MSSQTAYSVIGDPVSHSISPRLHRLLMDYLDIQSAYEAVHVRCGQLESFVTGARETHRPGWNVTLPHKTDIIDFLDTVDPQAFRIGAVNTVKNDSGRLTGYNTDVAGCEAALKRAGFTGGSKAVILGAGGAARAAVAALACMGVHHIVFINQNLERARRLRDDFTGFGPLTITLHTWCEEKIGDALKDADVLINATPVGLLPNINDSPLADDALLPPGLTVFDMIPGTEPTRLLRQARSRGCRTADGLSMLVAQAIAAQEIWLDRTLPAECFDFVYEELKEG